MTQYVAGIVGITVFACGIGSPGPKISVRPYVCGVASAAPKVSVTHATTKILPRQAPPTGASAYHMYAARNEFEAAQVIVSGPAGAVKASPSGLAGPGATIPVRFFREGLIDLDEATAGDGWTGPTPDPMIPDVDDVVGERRNAFPFDVPSGENRVIFAEVLVPPNAAAGDYKGTVSIESTDGAAKVDLTLTVWDFAIPATSSLRSAFLIWEGSIGDGHGQSGNDLAARYAQLGLDHRITFTELIGGPEGYGSALGKLIEGTGPTQLKGARITAVEVGGNYDGWKDYFAERSWPFLFYQYSCDEPADFGGWDRCRSRAEEARAAGIPALITASAAELESADMADLTDITVPLINRLGDPSDYGAWSRPGDRREFWSYQSCASHGCGGDERGWASYMIDATATRNRAHPWLNFKWGATGELYWDTTYAYSEGNPWESQFYFSGNGDGTFLYPGTPERIGGKTHIPIASLRMKLIREGYEDYEYLKLVSDLGDRDFALSAANDVYPAANETDADPEQLLAARQKLAERILALGGGEQPPAEENPTPGEEVPGEGEPSVQPDAGGALDGGGVRPSEGEADAGPPWDDDAGRPGSGASPANGGGGLQATCNLGSGRTNAEPHAGLLLGMVLLGVRQLRRRRR